MTDEHAYGQKAARVSEWVIEQLQKRFKPFPAPEDRKFNPSEKSTEELLELGLPPKPDADLQPRLRQLWDRAFAKEMTVIPFCSTNRRCWPFSQMRSRQVDEMPIQETRFEISSNWSGVYITANGDRQFMQIWGVWIVPEQVDLPPVEYQGPSNLPYVCSNWIGLDGQRRYLNSSLPQMGTATTLNSSGPPTAEAWTQWWARRNSGTVPYPSDLRSIRATRW